VLVAMGELLSLVVVVVLIGVVIYYAVEAIGIIFYSYDLISMMLLDYCKIKSN